MNIPVLDYQFVSLWMRIFLSIIILLASSLLEKAINEKTYKKNTGIIQWIAVLLIVKDFVFMIYPAAWIFMLSDTITVSAYYLMTVNIIGEKKVDSYYYRFLMLFHVILFVCFKISGEIPVNIIYSVFTAVNAASAILRMYYIHDNYDTTVVKLRKPALTVFCIYAAAVLLWGYNSFAVMVFIMPLTYLLHIYVMYLSSASEYRSKLNTIRLMKEDKISTYDFFKSIGQVMLEKNDIDEVNEYIISIITAKSAAESGAVILFNEYSGQLYISALTGNFVFPGPVDSSIKTDINSFREFFRQHSIIPIDTLVDKVFKEGNPLFVPDVFTMRHDPLFRDNTGNNFIFISSIILIPLYVNGKHIGLICVEHNTPGKQFTDETFSVVNSLAVYAEIMITNISVHREILEKRELDRDITLTSGIQRSLLPRKIPASENFSFAVYSKPARFVSGDYYDFLTFENGKIAFLICDVAGKGIAAGLVMTAIRTTVHLVAGEDWRTSSVMKMINRGIYDIGGDHFATAMFFIYDPETGMLEYSNAAHIPAVLYRSEVSSLCHLDTEGLPLGVDRESEYGWSSIKLNKDDILLVYTDGINETMNSIKEQIGRERINEIIMDCCTLDTGMISAGISSSIDDFRGETPLHDDQTFIVLKILKLEDQKR